MPRDVRFTLFITDILSWLRCAYISRLGVRGKGEWTEFDWGFFAALAAIGAAAGLKLEDWIQLDDKPKS